MGSTAVTRIEADAVFLTAGAPAGARPVSVRFRGNPDLRHECALNRSQLATGSQKSGIGFTANLDESCEAPPAPPKTTPSLCSSAGPTSARRSASSPPPRRASVLRRPISFRGSRSRASSASSPEMRTISSNRRAARGPRRPHSRGPASAAARARGSRSPKPARMPHSRLTKAQCYTRSRRPRTRS
jgi:hypothetical protein